MSIWSYHHAWWYLLPPTMTARPCKNTSTYKFDTKRSKLAAMPRRTTFSKTWLRAAALGGSRYDRWKAKLFFVLFFFFSTLHSRVRSTCCKQAANPCLPSRNAGHAWRQHILWLGLVHLGCCFLDDHDMQSSALQMDQGASRAQDRDFTSPSTYFLKMVGGVK